MLTPEQQAQMKASGFDVKFVSKRGTFIIDPAGDIRYIDLKVSVKTHGADLAKKLAELQAGG